MLRFRILVHALQVDDAHTARCITALLLIEFKISLDPAGTACIAIPLSGVSSPLLVHVIALVSVLSLLFTSGNDQKGMFS